MAARGIELGVWRSLPGWLLGLCLSLGVAQAQDFERACLGIDDQGDGLELAVDAIGDLHLSRVGRIGGQLFYTRIGPDGVASSEIVVNRIARFPTTQVKATGIIAVDGAVHICFHNKLSNRFQLATRNGADWSVETIEDGVEGDGCALAVDSGQLLIVYQGNGALRMVRGQPGQNWNPVTIDQVPGGRIGLDPSLVVADNGDAMVAHRDETEGALRLTWRRGQAWTGSAVESIFLGGGGSPQVVRVGAQYTIYHGIPASAPGQESDVALLETTGPLIGPYDTGRFNEVAVGGTVGAASGTLGTFVATRELSRSALFGDSDALLVYSGTPLQSSRLESYPPNATRHRLQFIRVAVDPFGLPVIAFLDEFGGGFGDSGAPVCYWRGRDDDGDRIPNDAEGLIGTNPNLPDTDGDGRTDGEEILIDGTDPTQGDACIPKVEACDNEDDDCDGRTDEGLSQACYGGPGGTQGVGRCRAGTAQCAAGEWGVCVGEVRPQAELCDGVDDDCDGQADEDAAGVGADCDAGGVGACGEGTTVCRNGGLVCVAGGALDEVCDGGDNDCDGRVDEGTLTCGQGACRVQVNRCRNGAEQACVPGPATGDDTDCDGVDDDCDGRIDEAFGVQVTNCGVGVCAAQGQRRCINGRAVDDCTPGEIWGGDSTCDGQDADCDGRVDEGFVPRPSTCGVGVCAAVGVSACVGGAVVEDCQPGDPAGDDAVCDGRDDDCDGETDEAVAVTPIACGVGVCRAAGFRRCVDGDFVDQCTPGDIWGSDSACDGFDADCDGRTDEGFNPRPVPCGTGVCAATGATACVAGAVVSQCTPGDPTGFDDECDGQDQDCDGASDEGFGETAIVCGVGACQRAGVRRCLDGQLSDDCGDAPVGGDDDDCDGQDQDCDGRVDEGFAPQPIGCGVGLCAARGSTACQGGRIVEDCTPEAPVGADANCDGADQDCDGRLDEGFVPLAIQCGVGACIADGARTCQDGVLVDACTPRGEAGDDDTCDGFDDDCDGRLDEAFVGGATQCGEGICAANGREVCVDGRVTDDCTPGGGVERDAGCDGLDSDCDGRIDEDFSPSPVTCGQGLCTASGARTCVEGRLVDLCEPSQPSGNDDTCDGIDEDCDGETDEGFRDTPVECGVGACATVGAETCVQGVVTTVCTPGNGAAEDVTCDRVDDDCDGREDEDFVGEAVECGVGVCQTQGTQRCVRGRIRDRCRAGEPTGDDANCDGADDDCDGETDEDHAPEPTTCGIGVCQADGVRRCVDGVLADDCTENPPWGGDSTCDGFDADCDGRVDERFVEQPTACGEGQCAEVGRTLCTAGGVRDTCEAGEPADDDARCDGADEDCDGAIDEDVRPVDTTCGVGVCAAVGVAQCVGGRLIDGCRPEAPRGDDTNCDGRDDDCDGRIDEGYRSAVIQCGQGECAATGRRICVGGVESDQCEPGRPAGADDQCDARDQDCDGRSDEGFAGPDTTCGVGVCAAEGRRICIDGNRADTCQPGAPQLGPDVCDGDDGDCDGRMDEDHAQTVTNCGVGLCANQGVLLCRGGAVRDTCQPGQPARGADVCDGIDSDCDGRVDEDHAVTATTCGEGVCQRAGVLQCRNGRQVDSCRPGAAQPGADICDGADTDCDGRADEDHRNALTQCGQGVCAAAGRNRCVDGALVDDCRPGAPQPGTDICDGRDGDCDGRTDEDHRQTPTACGAGACAARGVQTCTEGRLTDTCRPGPPTENTDLCDGVDGDCDGRVDEAHNRRRTQCGRGVCSATGRVECANGVPTDSCQPGEPRAGPDLCDADDGDCDGRIDEDHRAEVTRCGDGQCGARGRLLCQAGVLVDSCRPGAPRPGADRCDGVDSDCDGVTDESHIVIETNCGVGACVGQGQLLCVDGRVRDDCAAPQPDPGPDLCDGEDTDCDGRTDESFRARNSTCGLGQCAARGRLTCVDGEAQDTCEPGPPDPDSDGCDGADSDCDGETDEDHRVEATACGLGICAAEGLQLCRDTVSVDSCTPGEPLPGPDACDGRDTDCDGAADEDHDAVPTACGVGSCAAEGTLACRAGRVVDTCSPRAPLDAVDLCDGVDGDCDEAVDEDHVDRETRCGVGACQATGRLRCIDGRAEDTCAPAPALEGPDGCDDIDEDCDGRTDEDCIPGEMDAGDVGVDDAGVDAGDGDIFDGDLDAQAGDASDATSRAFDGPLFDSGGQFGPVGDGEFPELGPCPQPWDCVEPRGDETGLDQGCDCDQGGGGSEPILILVGAFLLGYRRRIRASRHHGSSLDPSRSDP